MRFAFLLRDFSSRTNWDVFDKRREHFCKCLLDVLFDRSACEPISPKYFQSRIIDFLESCGKCLDETYKITNVSTMIEPKQVSRRVYWISLLDYWWLSIFMITTHLLGNSGFDKWSVDRCVKFHRTPRSIDKRNNVAIPHLWALYIYWTKAFLASRKVQYLCHPWHFTHFLSLRWYKWAIRVLLWNEPSFSASRLHYSTGRRFFLYPYSAMLRGRHYDVHSRCFELSYASSWVFNVVETKYNTRNMQWYIFLKYKNKDFSFDGITCLFVRNYCSIPCRKPSAGKRNFHWYGHDHSSTVLGAFVCFDRCLVA